MSFGNTAWLEDEVRALRTKLAARDEEIAALRLSRDDWHKVADDRSAEIARLRVDSAELTHWHEVADAARARVAQLEAALRMWLANYELPGGWDSHEGIYGRIDAAAAARAALAGGVP